MKSGQIYHSSQMMNCSDMTNDWQERITKDTVAHS